MTLPDRYIEHGSQKEQVEQGCPSPSQIIIQIHDVKFQNVRSFSLSHVISPSFCITKCLLSEPL